MGWWSCTHCAKRWRSWWSSRPSQRTRKRGEKNERGFWRRRWPGGEEAEEMWTLPPARTHQKQVAPCFKLFKSPICIDHFSNILTQWSAYLWLVTVSTLKVMLALLGVHRKKIILETNGARHPSDIYFQAACMFSPQRVEPKMKCTWKYTVNSCIRTLLLLNELVDWNYHRLTHSLTIS